MNFRDLWLAMSRSEREALAARVDSTYPYLQKLAGGFGMPSVALAMRLKEALPKMRLKSQTQRTVALDGFQAVRADAGKRTKASRAES